MVDVGVRYELKTVKAMRGTEGRSSAKFLPLVGDVSVAGACYYRHGDRPCHHRLVNMIPRGSSRSAAAAAWTVAGLLFLLVWLHGARTHGLTQENERRLWLGLTWMDSAKFLVVPFLAVLLALHLSERAGRPLGRWGRLAWIALLVVVAVQTVGVALQFWPFPWGSYRMTFEASTERSAVGGALQAVGSLLGALLLIPTGAALVRAGTVRLWAVPVLVVGMLATFYLSPVSWVPALAWFVTALAIWTGGPRTTEVREPRSASQRHMQ